MVVFFALATIVSVFLTDGLLYALGFGHILPNTLQPITIHIFGTIIGVSLFLVILVIADLIFRTKLLSIGRSELIFYITLIASLAFITTLVILRATNVPYYMDGTLTTTFFVFFAISSTMMIYWRMYGHLPSFVGIPSYFVELVFAILGGAVLTIFLWGLLFL
jgi:hypothetical protein